MGCLGARIRRLVSDVLSFFGVFFDADFLGMTAFAEKKKPEWSNE